MSKIVVQAISGGMDSTCLLIHHLAQGSAVHLMSFDYGQKHRLELSRLDAQIDYLNTKLGNLFPSLPPNAPDFRAAHTRLVIPLSAIVSSALTSPERDLPRGHYEQDNMRDTVVPNRNAIFASFLYSLAVTIQQRNPDDKVVISSGVHSGDHEIYPDCREPFWDHLIESFHIGNWGREIQHDLPFLEMDKAEILRGALKDCDALGLDFDRVLANTSTSYAPTADGLADGTTGSDVERILAFYEIGRKDPVPYVGGWDAALENALKIERDYLKQRDAHT